MSIGLLFTYVMTYGGSAAALVRPYTGFLIYVCFGIIRPSDLWYWSVEPGNHSRILAVALIVGWAVHGFGDWRLGKAKVPALSLAAFILWAALSATTALVSSEAWGWVENQGKIVLPILIGVTLVDSVAKLRQLAWVVLLSHGYVAYEFNRSYFGGFNRLQEVGFGSLDNNCMGISLVTCCGLGGWMILSRCPLWQRGLAAVCVGLMVHSVLFSMSRGAMLGLIVLAGLSFLLMPKRPAYLALLAVAVIGTLAVAGPQVMERFGSSFAGEGDRDASAESRVKMWGMCVKIALENPLVGLGPHHFPVYAHTYGLTPGKEAHTTWLQVAAELGLPGVVFLLAFYLIPMVRLWPASRPNSQLPDPFLRDIARMVIASIGGFLFTAQFVTLPGLEAPYYVTLIGLGALRLLSVPPSPPAAAVPVETR